MAVFHMQIAGQTARVHALFDSTGAYFRPYLTEDAADFSVTVTPRDLEFEQRQLLEEALAEGFRVRRFTDPFLERAAIQRAFAERLLFFDTLLLHGSTVAVDGFAYLFTARSGTGKSTHTRLWRQVFGQRAVMVNDDKPFLQLTPEGVLAHGSPWSGKHGLDTNICLPLRGICLLERGSENRIRRAGREQLLPMLLHESCRPLEESRLPAWQQLVSTLADTVPLWHMTCTKDPEAAQVAYAAMSDK